MNASVKVWLQLLGMLLLLFAVGALIFWGSRTLRLQAVKGTPPPAAGRPAAG